MLRRAQLLDTRVNDKDVAHETQILRVVCSRFVAGER